MRALATAACLAALTGTVMGTAAATPIVEGTQTRELTGTLLGGFGTERVMLVEVVQRRGSDRYSAFQSFAEFGIDDTDVRLTGAGFADATADTAAPATTTAQTAPVVTLDVLPGFTLPTAETGALVPGVEPDALLGAEPATLGPDVALIGLSDDEGGDAGLPLIAFDAQDNADATPNPVPGAIWLLGSALAALGVARRRR